MTNLEKEISSFNTEEEYRSAPLLHFSMLSSYLKDGYTALIEPVSISTPSLTFGSIVDGLITDAEGKWKNSIYISNMTFTEKEIEILDYIYNHNSIEPKSVDDIDDNVIDLAKDFIRTAKKEDTKERKIRELVNTKMNSYLKRRGKNIISEADYDAALMCANKTKNYLEQFISPQDEITYQLKLCGILDNIHYKGMLDIVVVDDMNKTILPIDLKTTSKHEYDFVDSFITYKYYLQAELYTDLLQNAINKSDKYKNYTLKPFTFLVVSKQYKSPLLWQYDKNKSDLLSYKKVATEIQISMNTRAPYGCFNDEINSINKQLNNRIRYESYLKKD